MDFKNINNCLNLPDNILTIASFTPDPQGTLPQTPRVKEKKILLILVRNMNFSIQYNKLSNNIHWKKPFP